MYNLFMPTRYFRPTTTDEAVSLLAKYGERARIIAGGTDLLVDKPPDTECLVDVNHLGLNYIKSDEEGVKIGACTTIRNIKASPLIEKTPYDILIEAVRVFGTKQIRNMATVGGNICNALPSADLSPPLIALDSKAKISGPVREKVVPLEEFFVGVGKTVLKSDALLTEIQIPNQSPGAYGAFLKLGRTSVDIALVNTAVRVTLGTNRICKDARIVLGGGVAPTPFRAKEAENLLKGQRMGDLLIEKAALEASKQVKPRATSIRAPPDYKIETSKVLVKRALKQALNKANNEE